MAKSKKKKLKKKKAGPKKSSRVKVKSKKAKSVKKKPSKLKPKKTRKSAKKKEVIQKESKSAPKPVKISKKEEKQLKSKEKAALAPLEIVAKPADAAPLAPKQPSPKAIARARAALAAKEKQKTPPQPIDKAAAEKQLKLAEPKNKLVLEYIVHASPALLYEFITSPSGLSEWFADNVNITGSIYSFYWEGAEQKAKLLAIKENKSVRFQWADRPPASYFELRIEKNELTEELSLIITDFAESADEMNSLEVLWQGQVQRLMKVIGSKI